MTNKTEISFESPGILSMLSDLGDEDLDALAFGVIAFDSDCIIRRYNAPESRFTGLSVDRVVGRDLFTEVAQCMNNYLVAQRFKDALEEQTTLDVTLDFVLTWRMRPTPVQLRLLAAHDTNLRFLLLTRLA